MNQFVLHLVVLSHVFVIPTLKNVCVQQLERGLLTTENVVDVFQLAKLFDAPRLCLLCHRMIVKNFKVVSATEGWKVMKQSNPRLEKELLESVIDADTVSSNAPPLSFHIFNESYSSSFHASSLICITNINGTSLVSQLFI